MKIQDIIDKFYEKLRKQDFNIGVSEELSPVKLELFIQSSLTSLLDSNKEEATKMEIIDDGEYYSTEYKNGFNDCLEKVINIINSHR